MTIRHAVRSLAALPLFAALLLVATASQAQDDQALFTTTVPPNVVLMVDNSGSMHHVVWHPDYDPDVSPPCDYFDDDTQYFVNGTNGDTYPNGGTGDRYFRSGTYSITGTGCTTSPREIFHVPSVEADGQYTRWMGRYLNWLYSTASATNLTDLASTNNGTYSSCVGGGTYSLYRRSRIGAAQDILREVICRVNAAGEVRFGMAQFRRGETPDWDPQGGYIVVPAEDYLDTAGNPNSYTLNGSTQSHGDHLDDAIDDLTGESWTPLAETLFQVYTYFMSRNTTDIPAGRVSGTFPKYSYLPSHADNGDYSTASAPTVPDSPVQFECQKNFVVIITDGEPTKDDFTDDTNNTDAGFDVFDQLIGDFIPGDETETPGFCCDGSLYLDDVAKYMHETDMRPDLPAHSGQEQTVDIYTVGFTTSAFADDILGRTAAVGGGQFYRSNDPESLAEDIVLAITDILLKSQAFTSATVPAGRSSSDEKLYTSDFIPSSQNGFWEGHLRAWTINSLAQILDKNGTCALDDTECRSGDFLSSAEPFWDAAVVMKTAGEAGRTLRTTRLDGTGNVEVINFDMGIPTDVDLGVTAADITTYDFGANPVPGDAPTLANALVENIRGCELGTMDTGCVERTWLLGDIFHSNPLVVSKPDDFNRDISYKEFVTNFKTRDKVIVAGTNAGFLEIFDAGSWDPALNSGKGAYTAGTGSEIAGFMPYTARMNAKELARDKQSLDYYFVDGAPAAADAFLPTDPRVANLQNAAEWTSWKTVLVGGMRQGGKQYYALDITDPRGTTSCSATGSPNYPCYMWEFPKEGDTGSHVDFMGETWSEPVITKVKVNDGTATDDYGRYVAIVGAGYSEEGDPNDHTAYDVTTKGGRAILMIDLATGEILAMKKFDDTGVSAATDPATVAYDVNNPERSMYFAFPSQPGVFDVDFDGYADLVVIGDLGGNLWKWVLKNTGEDPILNNTYGTDQPNWNFSRFFAGESYLNAGTGLRSWKSIFFRPGLTRVGGTYWLAFGTGQRANLTWKDLTTTTDDDERLYAMKDLDLFMTVDPTPVSITETDIDGGVPGAADYTTTLGTCTPPTGLGFYVRGEARGEKFVTQPVVFAGYVIAASYAPATVVSCAASGDATLYTFSITCGQGLEVKNSVTGVTTTIVKSDMGDGMPSNPQVTSDNASGDTTVIVRMQDGKIWQPPGDFNAGGAGHGQLYWREL